MRQDELLTFMSERHKIYVRREMGEAKPWTDDPILQTYKFCNVYRELDRGTIWFAKNWRNTHEDCWFASLVYRFVNWPETAQDIGFPVPWKFKKFITAIDKRAAAGKKCYSSAYMISTHGVTQYKSLYLAESLDKIWKQRHIIRPRKNDTLYEFHTRLMSCFDVGSFLAGQVVADIKYSDPFLKKAEDWWTFAASGPGSRRGLNRVCQASPNNPPVDEPWKEEHWRRQLAELHEVLKPFLARVQMPPIHAQDLQNCLCEFDKYERVRLGEGRPKSKYPGLPTKGEQP